MLSNVRTVKGSSLLCLALAVAVVLSIIPSQAWALTAATFTTHPTFTSLNSGKWSRVYVDSATPTTYFVDVSTTQIKSVRINNADGSINSTATFALPGTLNAAVSAVEKVASVNRVYYMQIKSTTEIYAGIVNIDTGASISSATLTVSGYLTDDFVGIAVTKNSVYYIDKGNASGSLQAYFSTRALGSMTLAASASTGISGNANVPCDVSVDGAATAQDVIYCVISSGSQSKVYKVTSTALTSLANIGAASAGSNPGLTDVSGAMIARITTSGTTNTYTITKSTDAVSSSLYSNSWLTWANQQFDFNGVTRSFKVSSIAYYATSAQAVSWTANTGALNAAAQMYAATVTPSTGAIAGVSSTFYRISDTLIVTGSGTTWTPTTVTAVGVTPSVYTEKLFSSLALNSTVLANGGLVRLICDANYQFPQASTLYVGSDSDCTVWHTLDVSTNTIGRDLTYARVRNLVHASPYTYYIFHINVAAPDAYAVTISYGGKSVDSGNFDSAGNVQQRMLDGQCYTVAVTESSTGNSVQSGNICADGVSPKTVSLNGITIPDGWLGNVWSYTINRDYNNSTNPNANATNNHVLFTFEKNVSPYNATVHVYDNAFGTSAYDNWFNFGNGSGLSIINITGINSNQTLYFDVKEFNMTNVINAVSNGQFFNFGDYFTPYGLYFGLPVGAIFVLIVASMATKSNAHVFMIITAATAGIMTVFGFFTLNPTFFILGGVMVALGVVLGVKRQG